MDKTEYRVIIKYLVRKKQNATQIYKELCDVYEDSAPSRRTVDFWVGEYRRGRQSFEDNPRSGAPSTSVNDETIQAVEMRVMADRKITVRELANDLCISMGCVHKILHDHLNMNKCTTKWVPRILTPALKADRVSCCRELLDLARDPDVNFAERIVTGDESWIHHHDPETQMEARMWKHPDSPTAKRPLLKSSAGKVMMTVFWDRSGVLLVDYLPHRQTITGEYYADLMTKLREAIKQKRRGKLTAGPLLLHDNAPVHKSRKAQAAIRRCNFEELNHPPYSPDIAPSDFYLFANLKRHLRGKHFDSDEELIETVNDWFEAKDRDFYSKGIDGLSDRYQRVIDHDGDYFS